MARRPGTDVFRINVRGAGAVARDFDRAARAVQDQLIAQLRDYGRQGQAILRAHAPEDTGQLRDKIVAVPFFRAVRPRVSLRVEPLESHGDDGSTDYLDVTRRGHRSRRLHPTQARALAVHIAGHRAPPIYRAYVHGVPSDEGSKWRGDWVAEARPELEQLADRQERELGRRIERRLFA